MNKHANSQKGSMLVGNMIALVILGVSSAGLIHYTANVQRLVKSSVESVEYKPALKQAMINNLKGLLIEKTINEKGKSTHEKQGKEEPNNNIYGICSLVQLAQNTANVVTPTNDVVKLINLDLHNIENSKNPSWNLERWKHFFPQTEYEFESASECSSRFPDWTDDDDNSTTRQCLKYKSSEVSEIYASVSWTPTTFPKSEGEATILSLLTPIDTDNPEKAVLDSKEVVFFLKVELAGTDSNENGQDSLVISSQADMIWANDVGECHVPDPSAPADNEQYTLVKFSGVGPGSSLSRGVINSPYNVDTTGYVSGGPNCRHNIKIGELNQDIVQAGNVAGIRLSSLTSLNARISCTRNTFKCKNKLTDALPNPLDTHYQKILNEYDDLQFKFELTGFTEPEIPNATSLFTFKKGGQEEEWVSPLAEEPNTPLTANFTIGDRTDFKAIHAGQSTIQAVVTGAGIKKACHNICKQYQPSDPSTYIYPAITINATNEEDDEEKTCSFKSDWHVAQSNNNHQFNRVHCTVCYTKACHRYGLGTFGPFRQEFSGEEWDKFWEHLEKTSSQPDKRLNLSRTNILRELPLEPLDSQLPECTVQQNTAPQNSIALSNPDSDKKCVAINIETTKGLTNFANPEYTATSCKQLLPVLCFVGGQYRPAIKVDPNDPLKSAEVVKTNFKGAQKACMEMGQEIGKVYDLGILALRQWYGTITIDRSSNRNIQQMAEDTVTPFLKKGTSLANGFLANPETVQQYDFINNATRGMFLAPPTGYKQVNLTNKINTEILSATAAKNGKMWLAIERDNGGFVMASPPYADLTKNHPYALYFGKVLGNPIITFLKDKTTQLNSNGSYLALAHNIRWKGLYQENKNTSLPFLCKKEGQFFVTPTTAKAAIVTGSGDNENTKAGHTACQKIGSQFVPPISSMEWAQALLALNSHDPHLPFPDPLSDPKPHPLSSGQCQYPGAFLSINGKNKCKKLFPEGNSFLYEKEVEIKKAWVALKIKDEATNLVGNNGFTENIENLRYLNNFPANSIFYTPDEPLPTNETNMGIINGEGKLQELKLNNIAKKINGKVVTQIDENTYFKKLCLDKKSVNLEVIASNNICDEDKEEVTEGDLTDKYRKSIRFMVAWKQAVKLGDKFIINEEFLEEAKNQAKNKICKEIATDTFEICKSDCATSFHSCKNSCPADNPKTKHVNENQVCISRCKNQHTECNNDCTSKKDTNESNCDSSYEIKNTKVNFF